MQSYLDQLRFNLVGYGCTTCIGNSGPLSPEVTEAIHKDDLVAAAVLSRQPQLRGADQPRGPRQLPGLASLVVAYALAGTMDFDMHDEPLGNDQQGRPVFLKDIWPSQREIQDTILKSRSIRDVPEANTARSSKGDESWSSLPTPRVISTSGTRRPPT